MRFGWNELTPTSSCLLLLLDNALRFRYKPVSYVSCSGRNPVHSPLFRSIPEISSRMSKSHFVHFKDNTLGLGLVWRHHMTVISCFRDRNDRISHRNKGHEMRWSRRHWTPTSTQKQPCWPSTDQLAQGNHRLRQLKIAAIVTVEVAETPCSRSRTPVAINLTNN
jgi:hypothetical protein